MTNPEPIHPGEHLAEIMEELGISQCRLAKTIGVPSVRNQRHHQTPQVHNRRHALRIGRALGYHA